jgi:hypothetical protein
MKVKTSELTGAALDWAVAKCEGRQLTEPKRATNEEAEGKAVPFTMYGTRCTYKNGEVTAVDAEEIRVTRYGVNIAAGATAPSISFVSGDRRPALGSIDLFFWTREEAEKECNLYRNGGLEGFEPSTDWAQGGPIIEREHIELTFDRDGPDILWHAKKYAFDGTLLWSESGPTPLIAAMRCYVASKLGDEVEIPDELL